ncbi:hypothetical protein V6N13_023327 [Hibiscus sabdariffa]|uniref:Pentatricopeptide repeat-containing protein n=1 Tax=Hibiscus sabdariffa TaxID=183260 RepID=A0ABR2B5I8_9ROSI
MSKATGATSMRRLVGLFNASLSSATNPAAATAVKSSKPIADQRKFKKLADGFKKSSESSKFRDYYKKAYSVTVQRLASAKQFSLIDDILQHQKKYKEISQEGFVIRLMMLYGKVGMYEHAHKLFDEMPELNCQRTVNSLNALLSAYLHSKKFDNVAVSVIDTLEKKGLRPDIITFNTLLDGFFSRGQFADGEEIWGLMEKNNLVPDIRTYNTKLRGLVCERKISEAVEFWEEMMSKGIEPDIRSYNAMITGHCNAGNLEQVMKWYGELKKSCLPDRVTYITVLSFLRKKNEFEMASEICKEAMDRRMISGVALIDELVKESRIEEAIQFLESGLSRSALRLKYP